VSPERTGRVALVTGGSRGIGRACALALAGAGHRVALCYRSDKEGAAETAAAISEAGGEGLAVAADVADPAAVDGAVKEIESAWGPVQILVNNAGVTRDGLLLRMSDEQWGEVLRTNLDGAFYAIRRVAPGMVRGRFGRIVNVGSATGATGSAGQANYAAAKAGLLGLTRSVARELASRNVTCNLVAPGPIATAMLAALPEERQADLAAMVPLARHGTPEEVGAAGGGVYNRGRHPRRWRALHGALSHSLTTQRSKPMDRAEAFAILKEAAVEVLAVDPSAVTEEARFKEDLDADSLDLVEFVMALEERFDISVPEEELDGVDTVGQALTLVLGKLGANA